jgi:hypothetical protein
MRSFILFCRASLVSSLLVAAVDLSLARAGGDAPTMAELCRRFSDYDHNHDGLLEIRTLEPIVAGGTTGGRILLLLERRILQPLDGADDLTPHVKQLVADLGAEGYRADAIAVELGRAKIHQDGQYLLALRELLRAVAQQDKLAGVILVGNFPDAFLVRSCNWRRSGTITLRKNQETEKKYENVSYLYRVPGDLARRADVVLSDLDGRWEDVYVQPKTQLEAITAVLADGASPKGGRCLDVERRYVAFEDFFHIVDGRLDVTETRDAEGSFATSVVLSDDDCDHECGLRDRRRPNVMARPDILVSRLDARGVAWRPRNDVVGVDGAKLLDEQGNPHTVRFASKQKVPDWRNAIWEPDPRLERRLLAEYLARNHAYRNRSADVAWRPASFACALPSGYKVVRRAADDWVPSEAAAADVRGRPTLPEFVDWLRYPAVLRTIRAHSNPEISRLGKGALDELHARLSGPIWSWTPQGDTLKPSLSAACRGGSINWYLLHTLWENRAIAPQPAFYHHTGCNITSPPGARKLPYDDPAYDRRQAAESLLLFANGLALVGRAKVFNDEPRGFAEALRQGHTFGDAWARYFEIESATPKRQTGGGIARKRAYSWTVLGDWTLRLARHDKK